MTEVASKGLLSVEVKAPPIVAGTKATISLLIRNPFVEAVIIESIQAPSSAPLLPEKSQKIEGKADQIAPKQIKTKDEREDSLLQRFRIREVKLGPLVAEFPKPKSREVYFNMEPHSKLTIKTPFHQAENVYVNTAEGAEVIYDTPIPEPDIQSVESDSTRVIPPQQEDLASFELKTAHWLLVKPKVLELHALIRYKVGTERRSQVVPVILSLQPPVKSIVLGSASGSILGYLARHLTSGMTFDSLSSGGVIINLLGVIVMATILAIVLSRQESSKGFVTLEDFYGAFVAGAVLGYVGTTFFDSIMSTGVSGGSS